MLSRARRAASVLAASRLAPMATPAEFVVVAKPAPGDGGEAATAVVGSGSGGGGALAFCCCMGGSCAYDPSAPRELRNCACWRRASCRWRCGYCCCAGVGVAVLALVCLCIATAATTTVDCAALPGFPAGSAAANVPVVFAHGWTGSLLFRGGALVYLTALQAIGMGAPALDLPASWTGSLADVADPALFYQASDGASVAGGPAGLILDVRLTDCFAYEAYRTYVLWSTRCMNRPFYAFTYDWRRDNLETAAAHLAFVRSVSAAHGGSKVQLVGHSNGALLNLMLINRAPGLVHSAVHVAGAFTPGLGGLRSFRQPLLLGLTNDKSVPAAKRLTQSVEYSFLQLTASDRAWAGPRVAFKDSVTGADVPLDLSDPQVWCVRAAPPRPECLFVAPALWLTTSTRTFASTRVDYGFSFVASASDPQFAFLTAALRRAAVVRSLLAFNASILYPPTSVVTSHYNTSMESGNFTIDTTRHSVNWAAVGAPRPGDGSVCAACAVPPYTPSAGVFVSTHASYSRHFLLMNDVVTLKAAMDAIPYPSSPVPAT